MTRQIFSVTAFVVATTLMQHPVTGAKPGTARPTIVDLGTLGGGVSDAYGINNDPDDIQVVGYSTRADGFAHGFFWTAATGMIDLGSLGGSSFARAINNQGMIAGNSEDAVFENWPVVWTVSSGVWTIERLTDHDGHLPWQRARLEQWNQRRFVGRRRRRRASGPARHAP